MEITQDILNTYAAHIKNDYIKFQDGSLAWHEKNDGGASDALREHIRKSIENFTITFEVGKAYIRVIKKDRPDDQYGSAHSFICLADSGKFKVGDILKAAGWKAPAKNFKRGNVFRPESWVGTVRWMSAG